MEIKSGVLDENVPQSEFDAKGFGKCLCNELVEKLRVSDSKCKELKLEIEKIKRDNEILDTKFRALGEEKSAIEDELKVLKMENGSKPSYGGEEEDEILQLGIEIKILECEKQMAEKEVEIWKQKYKELESRISKLNQNQVLEKEGQEEAATPYNDTPDKRYGSIKEDKPGDQEERNRAKRVTRKMLFREDGQPLKKTALSVLSDARPASLSIIDVDGDEGDRNCSFSNDCATEGTEVGNIRPSKIGNSGVDEEVDDCEEDVQVFSTLKRKRATNVVTSDTESDIDDNIPISQSLGIRPLAKNSTRTSLKVKGCSPVSSDEVDDLRDTLTCSRRRLVKLSQNEEKGRKKKSRNAAEMKQDHVISASEDVQAVDDSAEGSDDESDRLIDFIDDDDCDGSSNELEDDLDSDDENFADSESDYQDGSDSADGSPDYPKWESEVDMLSAFGKDVTLCMKGVCAINRREIAKRRAYGVTFYSDRWESGLLDDAFSQENSEEEAPRPTSYPHRQGFSRYDAPRGSRLAAFLTEGDQNGEVKKSVEELNKYDPAGEDICYKLAARYSRQLFEIYKNKEDPYFPQS